jgi:hypothetical protein
MTSDLEQCLVGLLVEVELAAQNLKHRHTGSPIARLREERPDKTLNAVLKDQLSYFAIWAPYSVITHVAIVVCPIVRMFELCSAGQLWTVW